MLHRRLVDQRLAFLADAVYAVFVMLDIHTSRLTAFGADQHNIRDVKRGFKLDATGINGAALSLDLFLMLRVDIQTLDNHALLIRQDLDNLATLAFLLDLPADNFNGITFTDLDFHRSLLNRPKALLGPAKQSS
jgi:hypothetical protein